MENTPVSLFAVNPEKLVAENKKVIKEKAIDNEIHEDLKKSSPKADDKILVYDPKSKKKGKIFVHKDKKGKYILLDDLKSTFNLNVTSLTHYVHNAENPQQVDFKVEFDFKWKIYDNIDSEKPFSDDYYLVCYRMVTTSLVGLCLSGGGFRAALMHVGALRRMNELGLLRCVDTISSVSGGGVVNGVLAMNWENLKSKNFSNEAFDEYVRDPVYKMVRHNWSTSVFLGSRLNPANWLKKIKGWKNVTTGTYLSDKIKETYAPFGKKLSELPDPEKGNPFFVFCACDLRNGKPFYFTQRGVGELFPTRPYQIKDKLTIPTSESNRLVQELTISDAIAASASFPLAFQPFIVQYKNEKGEVHRAVCTDGGVFDNLGLDPLLARNIYAKVDKNQDNHHKFIFISDAGMPLFEDEDPSHVFIAKRSVDIIMNQVGVLRQRALLTVFKNKTKLGVEWGINDLLEYEQLYANALRQNNVDPISTPVTSETADHKESSKQLSCDNDVLATVQGTRTWIDFFKKLRTENTENFPDFEELFGIKMDGDGKFELKDAQIESSKRTIRMLTHVRTDFGPFSKEESNVCEMIGYVLCSLKIKRYLYDTLSTLNPSELNLKAPFDEKENFKMLRRPDKFEEYIRDAIGKSDDLWNTYVMRPLKDLVDWDSNNPKYK